MEASNMINAIFEKIDLDLKRDWQFKMTQYKDSLGIENKKYDLIRELIKKDTRDIYNVNTYILGY
jgi:hypothetical protein